MCPGIARQGARASVSLEKVTAATLKSVFVEWLHKDILRGETHYFDLILRKCLHLVLGKYLVGESKGATAQTEMRFLTVNLRLRKREKRVAAFQDV